MKIIKEIFDYEYFSDKQILITGGTGTIGNMLVDFLLTKTNCKKVCVFSRDEFKQHNMKKKFMNYKDYKKLRFFIGDIRDKDRIVYATQNIDIVIHAAALKQVDAIEYNPLEAIKTNILGTQNVIDGCITNKVEQLIGISTDKCVSAVNLYGATKLCLEKLIIAASTQIKTCILRYGNVIGSRGSVVPILFEQNKQNKDFSITHLDMTRFTITQQEALNFIINCITISEGGEIFIPKLPKYSLKQLCHFINKQNNIKIIGLRPGEKMHEEMISETESFNVYYKEDFYVVVHDMFKTFLNKYNYIKNEGIFSYSSKDAEPITDEELRHQLENYLN
tara:strand:- start:2214 stop:3215 length:1002 start_codon:yes stop_codon:yes gene_type:complete